jgi:TonB family protein
MKTPLLQGAVLALLLSATLVFNPIQSPAQESAEAGRKVLIRTPAAYPTLARSMNIRGVAKVEAQVAPNGTVKAVVVKGGHPILVQSAVTAVGHWKFEPAAHETRELVEIKFDPE